MGVSGLLPLLKSIQRHTKLSKYKDETIGVDGYVWLHRGAHGCALQLVQGKDTRDYVKYAVSRVRMLRHFGVNPYLVFDGDYLPSKKMTEEERAKRREASRKAALDLLAAGKTTQALQEAQKCVDVTPEMARDLITELQRLNVPYVVAPYEADAQLVYLEKLGFISGILSEDSDLLVFGAKRLLTKLDKYGDLVEINRRDFAACREVMLTGWTDADFRRMAIFSGCDYLKGLPQVGLKKAHSLMRKYKTPEKVVRMVMLEGKIRVPDNFLADFLQAELTFLHQRVYCPIKKELVFLNEPEPGKGIEDLPFIGAPVEPELARAIAKGDVHPMTKLPIKPAKTPDSAKRRHSQFSGVHNGTGVASGSGAAAAPRPPMRPIESYFGSHRRIAMGEMDPNCFSVDKQRLAVLTDNGRASIVFPLPRPYIDEASARPSRVQRRRTEPIANILDTFDELPPARSTNDAASARATTYGPLVSLTAPTSRPSKKARLCADLGELNATSSKFFKATPSAAKWRRHTDNFLMSDQSIDDALVELPDVDSWTPIKGRKSLGMFRDEEINIFCEESNAELEDKATEACGPVAAGSEVETGPEAEPPAESSAEAAVEVPVSPPTQRSMRQTLHHFSYTPTVQASRPRRANPTPPSSTSSASSHVERSVFTPASRASTPGTNPSTMRSLTPLQRIGARALSRQSLPPIKHNPIDIRRMGASSRPRSFPASNPSFVPLPRVDLAEIEALNKPCGSEDLIVPASDDDPAEDEELGLDCHSTARVLDLGQFVYA